MAIKLGGIARHVKIALTIAIICFCIGLVTAVPPTQPYTLYGTATLNGKVLTAQDDAVISVKVDGVELVSYTMGDIAGIDHYVLKVPMDSDPSVTTAAQEGDSAYIYINGVEINEGVQVIGAPATVVTLDISATSASNPPSTPTLNDPGTTDTDGSYTVSWSSVRSATSYTLEEDTSSSFSSPTVVHSGADTSKDVSGMSDGTYYYRVQACNAEGCSGWSNVEDIEVEISTGTVLTIVSYTISHSTITPPQTTEIDVAFSEKVSYKIAIENATGTIMYDWTGNAKNPQAKEWSGTYESDGTVVPAGDYTVNVTGTSTTTGLSVVHNTEIITVTSAVDTGTGTYPSIAGTHNGTITTNVTIQVSQLYTYPCAGTGGHTEHVIIWNESGIIAEADWGGYQVDGHNLSFDGSFTLAANETYSYTIRTGSYPQIIHADSKTVAGGTITCDTFVDTNGNTYTDWIPAIRFGV